MAYAKNIESSTGANAAYHRIAALALDWGNRALRATIASFYSREAREAGKGALDTTDITISGEEFPFADGLPAMRQLLGLGDKQTLLGAYLQFDGPLAHCRAMVQHAVAGKPVNAELQFQLRKEELPLDFLAELYALVTGRVAVFADAEAA
jgi:hypothetical protein